MKTTTSSKLKVPKKVTNRKRSGASPGRLLSQHMRDMAGIFALIAAFGGTVSIAIRVHPQGGTVQQ